MTSLRSDRRRITLFILSSVVIWIAASTSYQVANTLNRLKVVEQERDQWQRAPEIIQPLNLRDGSVVADLGCGSGYFALKLSSAVGGRGTVLAIDLRRLSLAFLWVRALLRNEHNISIIHAVPDNPRLQGAVDAVLVVNTYHELTQPKAVLGHVFQSLVSGGRLVITDRSPKPNGIGAGESVIEPHEIASSLVEEQLARQGFKILTRQDAFLKQPGEKSWWLIVARKP